jgi:threonine/homoserine/homoserine lactone efflux protein
VRRAPEDARRGEWRTDNLVCPDRQDCLSSTSSFIVGMTLALTSPWSIAFWIAVVGQTRGSTRSLESTLLFVGAVIIGAAAWGVILSGIVGGLQRRLEGRRWEIATQLLTGCVMIAFAIRTAAVLAHRS